jgi:hypothetical protein
VVRRDEILDSRATVPDGVVHRDFEAETLLLNLRSGTYHGLNVTGGRMLARRSSDWRASTACRRRTSPPTWRSSARSWPTAACWS